jgi:monomeric isocitrate dehydrogenase
MEVKATVPKLGDLELTAEVNLGANLDEAKELFGDDVVFSIYLAEAIIKAQAVMRGLALKEKTAAEIAEYMTTWKPGQSRVSGEAGLGSLLKKFEKMSPEKQKELIAKLLASSGDDVPVE